MNVFAVARSALNSLLSAAAFCLAKVGGFLLLAALGTVVGALMALVWFVGAVTGRLRRVRLPQTAVSRQGAPTSSLVPSA